MTPGGSRKSSKQTVIGEGSMELEAMRKRSEMPQKPTVPVEEIERPERKISNYSDGFLSVRPAAAVDEASEEDSAGSATTETQWSLSRTYAVTLYSSELSSDLGGETKAKTKARTYAINMPKDAALSGDATPPPPRGVFRRRSTDFSSESTPRNSSDLSVARAATKLHVWTDSDLLNVKTSEVAAVNGDAQAFIRVAFKPNSQPQRTREFVYIQEADSKVPVECLGFDVEYI